MRPIRPQDRKEEGIAGGSRDPTQEPRRVSSGDKATLLKARVSGNSFKIKKKYNGRFFFFLSVQGVDYPFSSNLKKCFIRQFFCDVTL